MTKTYTDIKEIIDLSINWTGENEELDCNLILQEGGQDFKAYTVSVCNRNLLFYTGKACISYVIDSYGDKHFLSLMSIEY